MLTKVVLAVVSVNIGMLIGAVGVGGILLPSALMAFADIALRQSMATSLFTFIFTGIAGTLYFQGKGSLDWTLAKPVCLGAVLAGFAGAWANSRLSATALSFILAAVIIAAGLYTLLGSACQQAARWNDRPRMQWWLLAAIGAVTGFGSGLTGIGGPALSVPLMVLCGFPVLAAIGVSQVLQVAGAVSGSIANLHYGTVDLPLAWLITMFEIGGVVIGAYLIHRIDISRAKKIVGALCMVAGCAFMWRSIAALAA
jgi:hypothetical protein